jgi:hypothetical protein
MPSSITTPLSLPRRRFSIILIKHPSGREISTDREQFKWSSKTANPMPKMQSLNLSFKKVSNSQRTNLAIMSFRSYSKMEMRLTSSDFLRLSNSTFFYFLRIVTDAESSKKLFNLRRGTANCRLIWWDSSSLTPCISFRTSMGIMWCKSASK